MICIAGILVLWAAIAPADAAEKDLGRFSVNPYAPGATATPAQQFAPDSVTNPSGRYGNRFSPNSANNPYATDAPKLYDDAGRYRGKLSANPYDPDSISNPFGRYGSSASPDSINNPFGAGSAFRADSPHNRFGHGLRIVGEK